MGIIVWLIAPIPLSILYFIVRKKKKKHEEMLLHLFMQQRITPEELTLAGVKLPNAAPAVQQITQQTPAFPENAPFIPMPEPAAAPPSPPR